MGSFLVPKILDHKDGCLVILIQIQKKVNVVSTWSGLQLEELAPKKNTHEVVSREGELKEVDTKEKK